MTIQGVLFNPEGRIQANQFWRGVIVLVAIQIILSVLPVLGINLGVLSTLLSLLIIYPYLCVYGKRLHDSNKSAWMFLLFVLGHLLITSLSLFFIPGLGDFFSEYMVLAEEGDQEGLTVLLQEFAATSGRAITYVSLGGLLVSNILMGFIVARMHSDPNTNAYGPPSGTGTDDGADTFS